MVDREREREKQADELQESVKNDDNVKSMRLIRWLLVRILLVRERKSEGEEGRKQNGKHHLHTDYYSLDERSKSDIHEVSWRVVEEENGRASKSKRF